MVPDNFLLNQRYHILSKVGEGGFGAVYKAEDTAFDNRLVAVKEMSDAGLSAQELAEASAAFKRETLLLAKLMHPNLPSIYDHFAEQGHWYVVMDFIEGETIETRLNQTPHGYLPIAKVLEIGIQLCAVLDYLHTRQPPIIFRDLKPSNIILTPDGYIYLIDFGIARHFKPGKSRDTIAFGSPGYAAPEQYGKTQTTPHADIYSLGVTLYQMLTGIDPTQTPFQFTPLKLPGHQALPLGLDTLIMNMLELDETKHPDTMRIVKQELQRISVQLAIQAVTPQPPASPIQSAVSGNRLYIYREHKGEVRTLSWSPDGETIASAGNDRSMHLWRPLLSGDTDFVYTNHSDCIHAVAWSPDGQRIASASADHTVHVWSATLSHRWLKSLAFLTGFHYLSYTGHTGAVYTVTWSPDGVFIASAGNERAVHVWNSTTGELSVVYKGHSDIIRAVQWSPDGRYLASSSNDHTIRIWNAQTAHNLHLLRAPSSIAYALAWSPDSRYLALGASDHTAQIWDIVVGRKILTYEGHTSEVYSIAWSPDGKEVASGGGDGTFQIWDAITGNTLFTDRNRSTAVRAIAWSPDGLYLACTGYDKTVDVWQIFGK